MRDITFYDGDRMLIIEIPDLLGMPPSSRNRVKDIFQTSRAYFKTIIVLVGPNMGISALPNWMRKYVRGGLLRPKMGEFNSYYIMEQGPDLTWIKEA